MPPAVKRAVPTAPVDPEDIVDELNEEYPVPSIEDTPVVGQDVDTVVAKLQAQMAQQSTMIAQLMAERGIPADPIAAQIQALQDHLHAQANANPLHADVYAPVLSYVDGLKSETLTTGKAFKARNLVEDLHESRSTHELAYAKQLAKGLHTLTLDPESDE